MRNSKLEGWVVKTMEYARTVGHFIRRTIPGVLVSGLLLAMGCNDTTRPNEPATEDTTGQSRQAYNAGRTQYIVNITNATLTNITLTFEASAGSSTHYLDTERVKGSLYAPGVSPHNCSTMSVRNDPANELQELSFTQDCEPGTSLSGYSLIRITDGSTPNFGLAKIKINGYVNGECFEDWEVVDWMTPALLYINASGGTNNGTCKLGNFLQPYR